ncbi:MAG: hypothetical protein EON47_12085, partial [Acetobacteraceae bacterium]
MLTGILLGIGLLGLLALAAVALVALDQGQDRRAGLAVHGGCLGISLGLAGLALAGLALGLPETPMVLPFGPPWAGRRAERIERGAGAGEAEQQQEPGRKPVQRHHRGTLPPGPGRAEGQHHRGLRQAER